MQRLVLASTIVALLIYSIGGLVPLRYTPHDHLLIGFVTAEELRAHIAAESSGMQDPGETNSVASPSSVVALTRTSGLIISVVPGLAGLISAVHLEIAFQVTLLLFIPLAYRSILTLHFFPVGNTLPPPDPPPRWIRSPI